MRRSHYVVAGLLAAAGIATVGVYRAAARQGQGQNPVQVQMTVSVEPRHGMEIPQITRDDIVVTEGHDHDKVTKWVAAQGANAGLDLLILVDDSSAISLGSQFEDIRAFINSQPPTTFIGIGYIQNGTVRMVQTFTQDHASAAKTLRLPMGAAAGMASPYMSISDYVVKNWPANPARPRHVMLMLTSGVDVYYGGGPIDPYVDEAIEDAQRAGIVIYSIYTPSSGHAGHSYYLNYWAKNYLSEVSEMTGGESYWLGFGPAVNFTPYLDQLSHQLQHQYLLTFTPQPEKKAGLQRVRLSTEVPGVDLVAPKSVFVPATTD